MIKLIARGFISACLVLMVLPGNIFASDKIPVFVSILPQKYFVQQIGKDQVDVQVMVPPGANPATYEPKPSQMAALSKAKLYFSIGVPFENAWLDKIAAANPDMKIIHTDHGIDKIPMATHHHHESEHSDATHHHGDESHPVDARDPHDGNTYENGHEKEDPHRKGLDPHIWLSPKLVKIQAGNILNALRVIDPAYKILYETNCESFVSQIDMLDRELEKIFDREAGLQFMVFHPAWGYFADSYGLEQVPIEIEGKEPKPAQLKELIEHARKSAIRVIFVQPQFSTKSAKVIAGEIHGQVAFADPLAEDWMANLRQVAEKFRAALGNL